MLNKQNIFKFFSVLLTIGAIYFGFRYLGDIYSEIKGQDIETDFVFIVLSVLFFFLFYSLLSIHWNRVSKTFNHNSNKQYLAFYASQPYKYLPTSLFTFSFRAKYSKDLGMSVKKSSLAQLLENINMLSSGMVVGAMFYLSYVGYYFASAIIVILALVGYHLLPRSIEFSIKSKTLKINKKNELFNLLLTTLAWVASGISFYLLSMGLGVSTGIVEALSANALAYTLGIVAFFAPGGIGIREWVFSLFSISSAVVLGWRIMTFLADLVLGFVGILLIYRQKKLL